MLSQCFLRLSPWRCEVPSSTVVCDEPFEWQFRGCTQLLGSSTDLKHARNTADAQIAPIDAPTPAQYMKTLEFSMQSAYCARRQRVYSILNLSRTGFKFK